MKSILGFLANLLLFLSISTLLFSIAAYFAFKLKGKRKPKAKAVAADGQGVAIRANEPSLLQPYMQPEASKSTTNPPSKKASQKHSNP